MAEQARSVAALLERGAAGTPALLAPERPTMDYDRLRRLVARTTARLNALGVGRGDRVAIVLPNGPEMAAAFVAIANAATTAPLNPAYREDELDFYLGDLNAKALVVMAGDDGPAVTVARRRGIAVVRLVVPMAAAAGEFELEGEAAGTAASPGDAQPDDVALVLHT